MNTIAQTSGVVNTLRITDIVFMVAEPVAETPAPAKHRRITVHSSRHEPYEEPYQVESDPDAPLPF